jgi:peptide/nickel transport system substrate-binding protein
MEDQRRDLSRRGLLLAAGTGLAGLYAAGCGGSDAKLPAAKSGGTKVAAGVPGPKSTGGRPGGRLLVAWETEADSYDPAIGYNLNAWDAQCCLLNAPLLVFGANGSAPVPNAATAMPETNANGTEYTIKLRPGVKFHNGRAVTAEDYKYTWERLLDPKLASWAGSYLYAVEGAQAVSDGKAKHLAGVEAVDEQTIVVRLTQPDATFVNLLASPYMAALPKEEVERHGDEFGKNFVGTGPFKLTEYDGKNQRAVFERNPDYLWKGLPYLDAVEYHWGIQPQLQLLQLKSGKIDALGGGIGASLVSKVNAQPSLKPYVQPISLQAVRWVGLNVEREPFKDPRVRQALNWAVDREQLGRVTFGESEPWGAPFPKNLPDYRRTAQPYGYDPEKAKALLAEAGVEHPSFEFLTSGEDPWPKLAQIMQQQLEAVGIQMKIRTVASSAFDALIAKHEPAAFEASWYMVQPTALDIINTNYISGGSSNYGQYSNAEVDKLAAQAGKALEEGPRNDIIATIEDRITQDAPGVYLSSLNFILGRSPDLENFQYNPIYGTYYDRLWKA